MPYIFVFSNFPIGVILQFRILRKNAKTGISERGVGFRSFFGLSLYRGQSQGRSLLNYSNTFFRVVAVRKRGIAKDWVRNLYS